MTFDELNALDNEAAAAELMRCCGSSRWSRQMAAARPFADAGAMSDAADAVWWALDRADWLEAFAAHPKIGAGGTGAAGRTGADWSDEEQRGVADAGDETRRRLAEANREYEARFGYIFIVCATGRTAAEMLALLEGRLRHDAGDELRIAAEEQRRITQLRLRKLLEPEPDALS
jgi:2-oxo-4-hydroxy-4-carboxy-5-ureidoimidazoline decarboxylase